MSQLNFLRLGVAHPFLHPIHPCAVLLPFAHCLRKASHAYLLALDGGLAIAGFARYFAKDGQFCPNINWAKAIVLRDEPADPSDLEAQTQSHSGGKVGEASP